MPTKATYYPPTTRVRVLYPADPYAGQSGTVTRTYNDGGDMVHVVRFGDGSTGEYDHSEIAAAEGTPVPDQRNNQRRTGS